MIFKNINKWKNLPENLSVIFCFFEVFEITKSTSASERFEKPELVVLKKFKELHNIGVEQNWLPFPCKPATTVQIGTGSS